MIKEMLNIYKKYKNSFNYNIRIKIKYIQLNKK